MVNLFKKYVLKYLFRNKGKKDTKNDKYIVQNMVEK